MYLKSYTFHICPLYHWVVFVLIRRANTQTLSIMGVSFSSNFQFFFVSELQGMLNILCAVRVNGILALWLESDGKWQIRSFHSEFTGLSLIILNIYHICFHYECYCRLACLLEFGWQTTCKNTREKISRWRRKTMHGMISFFTADQ